MIKKWLTVIGKTILLLIGITFLSFLLVYHSPGDPAMVALKKSGMRVSEEALELKREELGLNDPFAVQYGRWLNEFFHGDLGESYKTGKAVAAKPAAMPQYRASAVLCQDPYHGKNQRFHAYS